MAGPYGPIGTGVSGSNYTVADLSDVLLAYFTRYSPNLDTVEELPDNEGIPVGCPFLLENTSFSLLWKDCNVTWNELNNGGTNIFDFEPDNPGTGDIFTITDTVSGESISYTANFGDTSEIVAISLETEWNNKRAANILPWTRFIVSVVLTDSGYVLRAKGIGTNSMTTHINFVSSVTNGFSLNNQTFVTEIITQGDLFTWDSANRNNFTEIEWTIYKPATETPAYTYTVGGHIADYEKIAIVLPYVGTYTIEMRLTDTYNNISVCSKNDYLTVEAKEVEFAGFYKFREKEYYWDLDGGVTWDKYCSYWNLPILPNYQMTFANASLYESLDRSNYILNNFVQADPNFHIQNYQNNGNISFAGPYFWDNIEELDWDDVYHLWWESTDVSGDTPAHFDIIYVSPSGFLYIDEVEFQFGPTISTFQDAADELNSSDDSVISKYIYNVVYDSNDNQRYIHAVAKYFGITGDFQQVYGETGLVVVNNAGNSKTRNPGWNDTHFINTGKKLPRGVFITFVYDMCRIPGKTSPVWTIKNLTDPSWANIYHNGKYLGYLFKYSGNYSISLELSDTNGNKKIVERNLLVVQ